MNQTERPAFDIERAARDSRVVRRIIIQNDKLAAHQSKLALDLARECRGLCSEADAIEWGRAMITAGSSLAGLYVSIKDSIAIDIAPLLMNVLGWAGLDLMDGNR